MKNTKYLYRDTVTGRFLSAKKAEKLEPEFVVREEVKDNRSLWERLKSYCAAWLRP